MRITFDTQLKTNVINIDLIPTSSVWVLTCTVFTLQLLLSGIPQPSNSSLQLCHRLSAVIVFSVKLQSFCDCSVVEPQLDHCCAMVPYLYTVVPLACHRNTTLGHSNSRCTVVPPCDNCAQQQSCHSCTRNVPQLCYSYTALVIESYCSCVLLFFLISKYTLFAQQLQLIYNTSQIKQSNTMCNDKYKYSLSTWMNSA